MRRLEKESDAHKYTMEVMLEDMERLKVSNSTNTTKYLPLKYCFVINTINQFENTDLLTDVYCKDILKPVASR